MVSEPKYKTKNGKALKILAPKQMLQRLSITLLKIKAGSTFKNFLNEVRQIIYTLYQAKEITKKLYNNIINLLKL